MGKKGNSERGLTCEMRQYTYKTVHINNLICESIFLKLMRRYNEGREERMRCSRGSARKAVREGSEKMGERVGECK